MPKSKYVLVTPAKNEAAHIGRLIESIVNQSEKPEKWVIISDGSTDDTDDIIKRYAGNYPFIEYIRLETRQQRDFGSKVRAIEHAYNILQQSEYDFFGNIDADITIPEDYYASILNKFKRNPTLGIAGGVIVDVADGLDNKVLYSLDSVGCAIQFFRRECYEGIGGYLPLRVGGEDAAAEIMARMSGWEVRTFPDLIVSHHRPLGSGMWNRWEAQFYAGMENYILGYHPLFFILKSINRVGMKPYIIGTLLMLSGYLWSGLLRKHREIPPDVVNYLRREQMSKMSSRIGAVLNRKTC